MRAVQGKGDPRASLSCLEEPAWPIWGAEANCKGLVTSRRERSFRRVIPNRQGPAGRVTPGTPTDGVFRELSPRGPLRRCHPCKWAPRGALSRTPAPGARGGWVGLGGHCQASLALPSFPPRRHPTPPQRENLRRSCSPPSPRRRGEGVLARALARRGLLRVWPGCNTPERKPLFPPGSLAAVLLPALEGHVLAWRCGVTVSLVSYSNFVFPG